MDALALGAMEEAGSRGNMKVRGTNNYYVSMSSPSTADVVLNLNNPHPSNGIMGNEAQQEFKLTTTRLGPLLCSVYSTKLQVLQDSYSYRTLNDRIQLHATCTRALKKKTCSGRLWDTQIRRRQDASTQALYLNQVLKKIAYPA